MIRDCGFEGKGVQLDGQILDPDQWAEKTFIETAVRDGQLFVQKGTYSLQFSLYLHLKCFVRV